MISSGSKSLVVFPSVRLPRRSMALVRNSMLSASADFPSPPWPSRQILRMSLAVYIRKLLLSWGPPPFTLRAVDGTTTISLYTKENSISMPFFAILPNPAKKSNLWKPGTGGKKPGNPKGFPVKVICSSLPHISPDSVFRRKKHAFYAEPDPPLSPSTCRPSMQAWNWSPDMVSWARRNSTTWKSFSRSSWRIFSQWE